MESISKEQAMESIYNYGIEVHCENLTTYWQHGEFSFPDTKHSCYYRRNGCIIKKGGCGKYIYFLIHQVSKDADICAVQKYIIEYEKTDETHYVIFYAYAPLPEEITSMLDLSYKFIRKGEWYDDSDIRKMIVEDNGIIKELCEKFLNDYDDNGKDKHFGLAYVFYSFFDDGDQSEIIGIFYKNKLVGLVSVDMFEKANLARISGLFVHEDYRRLGFGKRLVRAALAIYPDRKYIYSADNDNDASIELAKSLGFELAGANLWMYTY